MVDPEPASSEGYNAFEQHLEQPMTDTAHLSEWERLDPLMREAATAPHPLLVHSYAAVCMRDVMVDTTREARERVLTEAKQEVTRGSTVETCFRVGACICSLLELDLLCQLSAAMSRCRAVCLSGL